MKFTAAATVAALAQVASAHYWYDVSIYNGQTSSAAVRKPNRGQLYNPIKFSSNPAGDVKDGSTIDGVDSRCNQRPTVAGSVLAVTAGSSLSVRLAYGENIEHPGPTMVYMSRAPGDNVKNYDGSGDWFKIYQDGVCNQGGDFTKGAWCSYLKTTLQATIPKNTPNGEYLVRFEHVGIHRSHVGQPEHYVGCVQVKVSGGAASGSPGPTVKFPGAYRSSDAYANFNIYGGYKSFPFPGPAVWNGSGSSGPSPPPSGNPPPSNPPPSSPPPSSGCSAMYGQCGGSGYTGPKCCSSGSCKVSNEWYSQCL